MSCRPFSDPLRNGLSYLHTMGAIDNDYNIIDFKKFDLYNGRLRRQAVQDYGVTSVLFTADGSKVVPNKDAFAAIGQNLGSEAEDLIDDEGFSEEEVVIEEVQYKPSEVQATIASNNPEIASAEEIGEAWMNEEEFLAVQSALRNGLLTAKCD